MPANGVARGRQGRTPQFLTLGLLVVICILAFNYWNVSSRSRLLQRQVQEMTVTLEELAMKKVHLEKRSEALQSQIGDANKMNTLLKTDKETCAQERDQINKGKDDLLTQLSRLVKEKEAAVLSLEQLRKNASHSIELLMDLKTKYALLRADHQQIEEASRIEASKQDQTIVELQQQQRTAYLQVQQCNSIMSDLKNQVALLQAANQKCSATLQQPADQQPGNNVVQPVNQQNEMSPQQIDTARGNQPNRFVQQVYWQQKQQDYIRQQEQQRQQDYVRQQQQQRQQQQEQRGHLLYGLANQQQANNKEEHEGDELEQPVNKQQDPGPVQMEANADDNRDHRQQQQMFPDREQQQEGGNEQRMVDRHEVEDPQQHLAEQEDQNRGRNDLHVDENEDHRNNIDEEQDQGQQGQVEGGQQDEQEESDLSDVDIKEDQNAEDRDEDIDEGQVQAPAESDVDEDSSLTANDKMEGRVIEQEEIELQEEEEEDNGIEPEENDQGQQDLGNDEEDKVGNVRVVDEENINDNKDFREGALHAPRVPGVEDTGLN